VDLVNEQHIMRLEIGQQRSQIARFCDHGPRSRAKTDPELTRNDLSKRGLAQTRGTEEQRVIHRFAARPGAIYEDPQIVARGLLPDKLGQALRPQRGVGIVGLPIGRMEGCILGHQNGLNV